MHCFSEILKLKQLQLFVIGAPAPRKSKSIFLQLFCLSVNNHRQLCKWGFTSMGRPFWKLYACSFQLHGRGDFPIDKFWLAVHRSSWVPMQWKVCAFFFLISHLRTDNLKKKEKRIKKKLHEVFWEKSLRCFL